MRRMRRMGRASDRRPWCKHIILWWKYTSYNGMKRKFERQKKSVSFSCLTFVSRWGIFSGSTLQCSHTVSLYSHYTNICTVLLCIIYYRYIVQDMYDARYLGGWDCCWCCFCVFSSIFTVFLLLFSLFVPTIWRNSVCNSCMIATCHWICQYVMLCGFVCVCVLRQWWARAQRTRMRLSELRQWGQWLILSWNPYTYAWLQCNNSYNKEYKKKAKTTTTHKQQERVHSVFFVWLLLAVCWTYIPIHHILTKYITQCTHIKGRRRKKNRKKLWLNFSFIIIRVHMYVVIRFFRHFRLLPKLLQCSQLTTAECQPPLTCYSTDAHTISNSYSRIA